MAENDWNVSLPINHTKIGDIPSKIRDVKSSAKIIISKEHEAPSTDNAGGQHVRGSSRVYLESAATSLDPEGNSLDTSTTGDDGRLAVLTGSSNTLQVYVSTSAGVSTGWQDIAARRVYLAETMNANSKHIIGLPAATLSGSPLHVGQIDTTYVKGVSTGVLQVNLVGTYLAASGQEGITVLKTRNYQNDTAVGTSDIENTSNDWADMDDMSLTLTTTGGNVLVLFTATFESADNEDVLGLRLDLDSSPYCTQQHLLRLSVLGEPSGIDKTVSLHYLFTSLAAGEHTIKVQWKDVKGVVRQDGSDFPRILTAFEVPA